MTEIVPEIRKNESNNDDFDPSVDTYVEAPWTIIQSYFSTDCSRQIVTSQLSSFDHFVNIQLNRTIQMFNPLRIKRPDDYDAESGRYALEIMMSLDNVSMHRPQIHETNGSIKLMFPHDARLRGFNYSANITSDINITYLIRHGQDLATEHTINKIIPKVSIGKIPIMLHSSLCSLTQYRHQDPCILGECKNDPGGYFIIKGSEKVVLGQERSAENRILCYNISRTNIKYNFVAEIKSVVQDKCISPKQISIFSSAKNNGFGFPLHIQFTRIKSPVPLFVIFRALGILTDEEICEYIMLSLNDEKYSDMFNNLHASIIDANKIRTQEEAIAYISSQIGYVPIYSNNTHGTKNKKDYVVDSLNNDLFPHCKGLNTKLYFLGYMANKLMQLVFGFTIQDDRDAYMNKRIDLVGTSLNNLLRNYTNKMFNDMGKQVIREIKDGSWRSTEDYENIINCTNIHKIVKSATIENGLKRALSTGDFGTNKNGNNNKVGVAQVLNRLTFMATLSHLRRISTPMDKSGKFIPPRKLHGTSWGFLCPAETPEGQSVGIVKNIACMAVITNTSSYADLQQCVLPYISLIEDATPSELYEKVKVFVNGAWIGISHNPVTLYHTLKEMKYSGIINIYTSIVFKYATKEIVLCNDGGRIVRPIMRVTDNKISLTHSIIKDLDSNDLKWQDLLTNCILKKSLLEYIDAEEQSLALIATRPTDLVENTGNKIYKYTHCEIHPSTIFGFLASCIPFPDHNQSPRNSYQCAMGKQAVGVYASNFYERMDRTAYMLDYPTRPLVDTRIMNIINLDKMPAGCNITVAIMAYTGYNQEDSVLINEGSVRRGLFQATIYHTERDEDKHKTNGSDEIRCKPILSKTKDIKFGQYDKLNANGLIPENTLVENGDIIIGKVVPIKENKNNPTKVVKFGDQSKKYRTGEETYIDKTLLSKNDEGYTTAKVRLRATRQPEIGDKFSSRHGQKGTCGNVIPEENMPFTRNGLHPDIVINPHAIPSRMTIGQLKETLLGKVLVEIGMFGDGTSFGDLTVKTITEKLLDLGYEANGNELMYNGETGEQLEYDIFVGPVFYQRLKHMVVDKQHSRADGQMVSLTRQPAEGRSRDGGLRYGEMERDCMISHGAARFNKGRLYDASDKYSVHVCNDCGLIAAYNDSYHIHNCQSCRNQTNFSYVEIPYSCKLLFQELITMNVAPRLITDGTKTR